MAGQKDRPSQSEIAMHIVIPALLALCLTSTVGAHASSSNWTWIGPGNEARVVDTFGWPGRTVCVEAVDIVTSQPVAVHLRRDADLGSRKDLDQMSGQRIFETRGLRYRLYVKKTSSPPIYAERCGP